MLTVQAALALSADLVNVAKSHTITFLQSLDLLANLFHDADAFMAKNAS